MMVGSFEICLGVFLCWGDIVYFGFGLVAAGFAGCGRVRCLCVLQ